MFQCNKCSTTFSRADNLRRHEDSCSTPKTIMQCSMCEYKTPRRDTLIRHLKSNHQYTTEEVAAATPKPATRPPPKRQHQDNQPQPSTSKKVCNDAPTNQWTCNLRQESKLSPPLTRSKSKAIDDLGFDYTMKYELNRPLQYRYWNNIEELVDRLCLLHAARNAGNTSVGNEILAIEEELRKASIIV